MTLCRVSIAAPDGVVDVVLPTTVPVMTYLPALTDIVETHCATPLATWGNAPSLCRLDGSTLELGDSLLDSAISDGDVLVLTYARPPGAPPMSFDPARSISSAPESSATPAFPTALCASVGTVVLVVAAYAGGRAAALAAGAAAMVCVSVAAVTLRRSGGQRQLWCVVGTALSGVLGFFAVPGPPAAPNVLLGVTAAALCAVVTGHLSDSSRSRLVVVGVIATALSAAALGAVVFEDQLAAVGAALTILALTCLALAARLAMGAVGVAAAPPGDGFGVRRPERADRAGEITAGLTVGCAVAASVGVAVTLLGTVLGGGTFCGAVVFGSVVAATLLLRNRLYPSAASLVSAALSAGAVAVLIATHLPSWGACLGAAFVVAACASALMPSRVPTPTAARLLDLLYYTTLAASVPLAMWVSGAYTLIRGWNLV